MKKAKSRLKDEIITNPTKGKYFENTQTSQSTKQQPKKNFLHHNLSQTLSKRILILVFSLPFWWAVRYMLINVYPDRIKNYLIENSYFPLVFTFLMATFFGLNTFLLNSKRSFIFSLFLTSIFYFKLIHLQLTLQLFLLLFFFFSSFLLINQVLTKK